MGAQRGEGLWLTPSEGSLGGSHASDCQLIGHEEEERLRCQRLQPWHSGKGLMVEAPSQAVGNSSFKFQVLLRGIQEIHHDPPIQEAIALVV